MLTNESVLVGRKIKEVKMPDDENIEFFLEDGKKITWRTYGDCCSETWFESIDGIGYLRGGIVVEIIEKEIPKEVQEQLKSTRQESDQLYGYTLIVEIEGGEYDKDYNRIPRRERVDIEFRNSSNGYYGGDVTESEE